MGIGDIFKIKQFKERIASLEAEKASGRIWASPG